MLSEAKHPYLIPIIAQIRGRNRDSSLRSE
jgi:hypothetical protein